MVDIHSHIQPGLEDGATDIVGAPHAKIGGDFEASGHLSRSVFEEVGVPRESDIYLCGPTSFMVDMSEALATLGVSPERIHVEIFNGGESMYPGAVGAATRSPHPPTHDANTGPLVSFARSGIAVPSKASEYQCILELAEACDVLVRWPCRTGVCHNCESGLVSGEVVYGPEPLEKPPDSNILVCCSQPVRDVSSICAVCAYQAEAGARCAAFT